MKEGNGEFTQRPPEEDLGIVVPMPTWRMRDMPWIGAMLVASGTRIASVVSELEFRNILPEPLDLPDHVGNTAVTFAFLSYFANGFWGKELEAVSPENFERRRKGYALAMGSLTVAANVFAETIGYGKASTPDILDFAYGCLGGWLTYKAKKPDYLDPEVVQHGLQAYESGNPYRQVMEEALAKKRLSQVQARSVIEKTKDEPKSLSERPGVPNYAKRNRSKAKIQRNSRKQNRTKK